MFLKPCRYCPHSNGCQIKADLLAKMKLPSCVSAITFKCPTFDGLFHVGDPVIVDVPTHHLDEDGDDVWHPRQVTGYVVGKWRKYRLIIQVDCETKNGCGVVKYRVNTVRHDPSRPRQIAQEERVDLDEDIPY